VSMKIKVIQERGEDGYIVTRCHALKSCWSQGKTREKALRNIREVVELYLEATGDEYVFESRPHFQRVAFALSSILAIVLFGANQANAFIYFQF